MRGSARMIDYFVRIDPDEFNAATINTTTDCDIILVLYYRLPLILFLILIFKLSVCGMKCGCCCCNCSWCCCCCCLNCCTNVVVYQYQLSLDKITLSYPASLASSLECEQKHVYDMIRGSTRLNRHQVDHQYNLTADEYLCTF